MKYNKNFNSPVTLATFQMLRSHMWLVVFDLKSADSEQFQHHRRFCWKGAGLDQCILSINASCQAAGCEAWEREVERTLGYSQGTHVCHFTAVWLWSSLYHCSITLWNGNNKNDPVYWLGWETRMRSYKWIHMWTGFLQLIPWVPWPGPIPKYLPDPMLLDVPPEGSRV